MFEVVLAETQALGQPQELPGWALDAGYLGVEEGDDEDREQMAIPDLTGRVSRVNSGVGEDSIAMGGASQISLWLNWILMLVPL